MGRKTSKQMEREIIADYAETGSAAATARKFGVSDTTVGNIIRRCPESLDIIHDTEQVAADRMREYIDSQVPRVQGIISQLLDKISDAGTIEKANLLQSATTLGIVLDKFAPNVQQCGPVAIQINFGGNPANSEDNFG